MPTAEFRAQDSAVGITNGAPESVHGGFYSCSCMLDMEDRQAIIEMQRATVALPTFHNSSCARVAVAPEAPAPERAASAIKPFPRRTCERPPTRTRYEISHQPRVKGASACTTATATATITNAAAQITNPRPVVEDSGEAAVAVIGSLAAGFRYRIEPTGTRSATRRVAWERERRHICPLVMGKRRQSRVPGAWRQLNTSTPAHRGSVLAEPIGGAWLEELASIDPVRSVAGALPDDDHIWLAYTPAAVVASEAVGKAASVTCLERPRGSDHDRRRGGHGPVNRERFHDVHLRPPRPRSHPPAAGERVSDVQ